MTTPNPQVPDPNAVAGYNPQQVPAPPQVEYAPVEAMQPDMQQSWGQMPVGAEMQAGFPQPGPGVYGWLVICGFALPCRGAHWAHSRQSWRWWRRLVMARSHHVVLPHAARHHPYPGLWNRGNCGCSDELILKELIPRDDRPRVEPPNGGDAGSFLSYLAW